MPTPSCPPVLSCVQVRAGLAKMAVKGMWGYMQTYEAALRWVGWVGGWVGGRVEGWLGGQAGLLGS